MGQKIYEQDTLVLAKVETTYGVDPAPTGAANAMRAKVNLTYLDGDQEALEYDAGRGGSKGSVQRNKRVTGDITCYLSGSGTAGTIPAFGPFLQMAGLKPTVTAGEKVVYTPVSDNYDSTALHVFRGKVKHPMLGARANLELSLGPNALPKFTFNNFIALFVDPTQVGAFQTADFSAFENPLVTDPVSITKMNLFGQEVNMSELMFKMGNTVTFRSVTNDQSVQITNRKPQLEITFEEPLLAVYNWWEQLSQFGALEYQLGDDVADEGSIVELNVPNVQIISITPSITDGISHLKMVLDIVPTARDNDFELIFR